jgi:TPR repeat protein
MTQRPLQTPKRFAAFAVQRWIACCCLTGFLAACLCAASGSAIAKLVTSEVPEAASRLVNKQQAVKADPSREAQLVKLATSGDRDAQVELGLRYAEGTQGIQQNIPQALKWFLLAANDGDRRGALGAGALYLLYGESPAQVRDGRMWLQRAREQGLARAHYVEALSLWRKTGGKRLAALDQVLKAGADARDGFAINMQGALLEREGKQAAARALFERASALGSPAGAANVARLKLNDKFLEYKSNPGGFDEDALNAEEAFEFAQRYHAGRGVSVDYLRAISLYELAARNRYAPAQRMLALIYSRRTAKGTLDPAWMRALSNIDPRTGSNTQSLLDDRLPVIDDRPLADLLNGVRNVKR